MRVERLVLFMFVSGIFFLASAACPTLTLPTEWNKYMCPALCDGAEPVSATTCTGLPQCPPNTVAQQADPAPSSELPVNGFFLLGIKGKSGLYKSPLKSYAPAMIPGTDRYKSSKLSTTIHIVEMHPAGQWILFTDRPLTDSSGSGREWRQNVHLMKTDGTGHVELPNAFGSEYIFSASWFYNSVNGNEIAILTYNYPTATKPNIYAIKVDFKPDGSAAFGASREIGKELGGALWGEFAVGGEFIVYRERGVNGAEPVSIFTIPDGGRGMATKATRYNGHFKQASFNCGITISPDGKLGAWNTARTYVNCIAGGHHGANVLPLRKNTDTLLNAYDWYFRHGTFTWSPLNIAKTDPDFHIYKWSTHMDYLVTYDQERRSGAYIVNWRSGKWYSLMPNTTAAGSDIPAVYPNVAAFVEGGTAAQNSSIRGNAGLPACTSTRSKVVDPLGRAYLSKAPLNRSEGLATWRLLLSDNLKVLKN